MRQPLYLAYLITLLLYCHSTWARPQLNDQIENELSKQTNKIIKPIENPTMCTVDFQEAYRNQLSHFTYEVLQKEHDLHELLIVYTKRIEAYSEQDNNRDKEILNSPFPGLHFNGFQNEICITKANYNAESRQLLLEDSFCNYIDEQQKLELSDLETAKQLYLKAEANSIIIALQFDFLATGSATIESSRDIKINHLNPLKLDSSNDLSAVFEFELQLIDKGQICEGTLRLHYSAPRENQVEFLEHSCAIN